MPGLQRATFVALLLAALVSPGASRLGAALPEGDPRFYSAMIDSLQINPDTLIFPDALAGSTTYSTATARNHSSLPITISTVDLFDTVHFALSQFRQMTIAPGDSAHVEFAFRPPFGTPAGTIATSALIQSPGQSSDTLTLIGRVVRATGEPVVTPGSMDVGDVVLAVCRDSTLTFVTPSGVDVVIDAVTLADGTSGFAVADSTGLTGMVQGGGSLPIPLRFCALRELCPARDTLLIRWRLFGDTLPSTIRVPLSACVRSASVLTMTPATFDFGRVEPGSCDTASVVVRNEGAAPVAWTALLQQGPFTILGGGQRTTPAKGSDTISILYCPPGDVAPIDSARLRIVANGSLVDSSGTLLLGRRRLLLAPTSIDLGTVPLGFCRDSLLPMQSRLGVSASVTFDLVDAPALLTATGARIAPGGIDSLRLSFCPASSLPGRFTAWIIPRIGSWSGDSIPVTGVVESSTWEVDTFREIRLPKDSCGLDSIVIRNTGGAPLRIDSLQIVRGGGMSIGGLPGDSLAAGADFVVRLETCTAPDTIVIVVMPRGYAPRTVTIVVLRDTLSVGRLFAIDTTIEFGDVAIGSRRTSSIRLGVTGGGDGSLISGTLLPDGSPFDVEGSYPLVVRQPAMIALPVTFTPPSVGAYVATWSGEGSGGTIRVLLRGRGVVRRLWLDSAEGRVGEAMRVGLRVTPPLTASDSIGGIEVDLRYPSRSLVPTTIAAPSGTTATTRFVDDSTLTLQVAAMRGYLSGELLAEVELIGLTRGRPNNSLRLIEGSVVGLPSPLATSGSQVLLEGCDLGDTTTLARRGAIRTITTDRGGSLRLDYHAPDGAPCRLRILDLAGSVAREIDLPSGDGSDRRAEVDLRSLAAGVYIIELRAGDARSTTAILLER